MWGCFHCAYVCLLNLGVKLLKKLNINKGIGVKGSLLAYCKFVCHSGKEFRCTERSWTVNSVVYHSYKPPATTLPPCFYQYISITSASWSALPGGISWKKFANNANSWTALGLFLLSVTYALLSSSWLEHVWQREWLMKLYIKTCAFLDSTSLVILFLACRVVPVYSHHLIFKLFYNLLFIWSKLICVRQE